MTTVHTRQLQQCTQSNQQQLHTRQLTIHKRQLQQYTRPNQQQLHTRKLQKYTQPNQQQLRTRQLKTRDNKYMYIYKTFQSFMSL